MNTPIWVSTPDGQHASHHLIVGQSGKGKSVLLQLEAARLGISYEELQLRYAPTEEEEAQMRIKVEEQAVTEARRLQAVRSAVWEAWLDDEWAFSRLHDVLVDTVARNGLSREQLKAVFMLLPASLIGKGISWGFTDTEVGDDMHEFVEDNRETILAVLEGTR